MGSVGNFLFGGGDSTQTGQNNSTSSSNSSNQSQNTSVQGAQSNSTNTSANASGSGNQSYGALESALTPSLGYVSSAGNMLGSLLGLPQSTFNYNTPAPSVLPPMPTPSAKGGTSSNIVQTLLSKFLAPPAAPAPTTPSATPAASTAPSPIIPASALGSGSGVAPVRVMTPNPIPNGGFGGGFGIASGGNASPSTGSAPPSTEALPHRAMGGPVAAGQPYVVGENQPEVFVPNQSGNILPRVPGSGGVKPNDLFGRGGRGGNPTPGPGPIPSPVPTTVPPVAAPTGVPIYNPPAPNSADAINNFANSSGMNFILDQGQKAISGASAGSGTFDSGATGKALEQYGQNLGSTTLNNYMGRLLDYAKLGLGSASALSGAGGVSQGVGTTSGTSGSTSFGNSQGTSSGISTGLGSSSGSTSGNSNTKNGLLPALGSIGL